MKPPHIIPLTSIRGIAAWWVAFYHFRAFLPFAMGSGISALVEQGYRAVDLFFILSGFVIYINYAGLFRSVSMASIKEFALSRFSRLYPLHLFMSLLFLLNPLAIALLSSHGDLSQRYSAMSYVLSLLLVQNWGLTDSGLAWNVPAWSISTEFAAYLLFPVLAFLILRALRSGASTIAFMIVGLAATAALFHFAHVPNMGAEVTRLGLARCVLQFAVGAALGHLYQRYGAPGRGGQAGLLAVAVVLFSLPALAESPDFLVFPAAFAALIYAMTRPSGIIARGLSHRYIVFLGEISYSTYLCHYFVKDWVKFLLVRPGIPNGIAFGCFIATTLVMSVFLFRHIELPGRRRIRQYVWARELLPTRSA